LFRTRDSEAIALHELLAGHGYKSILITAHPWFNDEVAGLGGWDEYFPLAQYLEKSATVVPSADEVVDFALAWVDRHRDSKFFLFVHLMDTHFPHRVGDDALHFLSGEQPSIEAVRRFAGNGTPKDDTLLWAPLSPDERRYLDAVYDGSLRFADRHVGRLVEGIQSLEPSGKSLVVVTADHGESLFEQPGRFGHIMEWNEEIGRVPWILYYPGRLEPRRVTSLTESVDIMPTVLGLSRISLPQEKSADGVDVLAAEHSRYVVERDHVFGARGVRGRRFKLLFDQRYDQSATRFPMTRTIDRELLDKARLYDLVLDPLEAEDVAAFHPEKLKHLGNMYVEKMSGPVRRLSGAIRSDPPVCRFAIPAKFFETVPEVPVVDFEASVEENRPVATGLAFDGWYRSIHPARYWFVADPGAARLNVRISLPNGRYGLTAAVRGRGSIEVTDGATVEFETDGLDVPDSFLTVETIASTEVDLGVVEVQDTLFSAFIEPNGRQSRCLIKYFGFRPLDNPPTASESIRRLREEQLRALGYAD
jgi:hypothetical protein